jgi:epoxyqueuosine reductase
VNSDRIKEKAHELGFELAGIAPVGPSPESDFYPEWLRRGYAGEMAYLERRVEDRNDPTRLLAGARSVVVCALNYESDKPLTTIDRARAWVSRYAWGEDYHSVVGQRLTELAGWIADEAGATARAYVDTGPLLERVYAKYAGIGWFGKNTCIINQGIGSWLFLGCILTDLQLSFDTPAPDRCGTCTRCIDACPTDAIVGPYELDSRKCISYLNIELRGSIPEDLREGMGHHLFGCDICQDVCPWNRRAPVGTEPRLTARRELFWPALDDLLELDDDGWRRIIRGTAMKRARVRGLVRNLMVVVGNSGLGRMAAKLEKFFDYPDPDVRSHARWAHDRLSSGDESSSARPSDR